nr:origin recognition complex subunit 3 [Hymenolepis microstoma]
MNLSSEVCKNAKDHIFKTYEMLLGNSSSLSPGLITTILMQTSVNIPDHMGMFHDLRRGICSMGGHVAIIEPGSNVSSAKSLFTLIVQKFLSDDEDFNDSSSAQAFLKKLPPSLRSSLAAVSEWYYMDREPDISAHLQDLNLNTPVKNPQAPKESVLNKGPLVVVIPAIEKVPNHVLQKLVRVTSLYVQKQQNQRHLPIFFVFGLSSTEELALDTQFDAQTLACLAIRRFKLPPPAVFTKSLFDELFNIPGFRASRQVVRYLIQQIHNCMDFSVANLLNHYKLAMHKHYLTLRQPKFLAPIETLEKYIGSLKEENLSSILSEFRSFVYFKEDQENKWAMSAIANLVVHSLDDISPHNKLVSMLSVHWLLQLVLPFILKWVFVLFKDLHGYSENDYLSGLYCDWMAGRLLNKELIQTFNTLDAKHVITAIESSVCQLTASVDVLKSLESTEDLKEQSHSVFRDDPFWAPFLSPAISLLSELHSAANDWLHRLNAASSAPTPSAASKLEEPAPELRKRMTLKELKEKLLKPRLSDRDGSPRAFNGPKTWSATINEFTRWICMVLSPRGDNPHSVLPSPLTLPMHEVFYGFGDAVSVADFKRNVDPQLGGSINRTLSHLDEFVVERRWPKDAVLGLKNRHPDICTVYKLLSESGSMFSLYDLLASFSSIIEPNSDHISQTTQARFLRAVSELELLGFARYTERRSDHAIKNPLLELVANLNV